MKYYETPDVDFFVEKQNNCSRYPSNKTWDYKPKDKVRFINIYRDYESAWQPSNFTRHCYYLNDPQWPKNRRRQGACLPFFFATGERFIKLEKDATFDSKCAPFPMSLQEVRDKVKNLTVEELAQLEEDDL